MSNSRSSVVLPLALFAVGCGLVAWLKFTPRNSSVTIEQSGHRQLDSASTLAAPAQTLPCVQCTNTGCSHQSLTPEALFESLVESPTNSARIRFWATKLNPSQQSELISRWAQKSNEGLIFAWKFSGSNPDSTLFRQALQELAKTRPDDLLSLLKLDPELRGARFAAVEELILAGKSELAFQMATLDPGTWNTYARARASATPGWTGTTEVRKLIEQNADPASIESLVQGIAVASSGSVENLNRFVSFAAENGALTATTLAILTSKIPPQSALDWLHKADLDPSLSLQAATGAFQSMLADNTGTAAQWLNSNPNAKFRDRLVSELCMMVLESQEELARQWAATISDPATRSELETWMREAKNPSTSIPLSTEE